MIQEIAESIWKVTSDAPGASLCLLGGTHGNEHTGIAVIQLLVEDFPSGARILTAGSLTLSLGNLDAIAQNVRFIDGRDLNRYFCAKHLEGNGGDGSKEEQRARLIAPLIATSDDTIDIHATNKPSVPFAASKTDENHERISRWFPLAYILADPTYIFAGEPVTTDEYADTVGKIGICVETGISTDVTKIPETLLAIENIMADLGMISIEHPPKLPETQPLIVTLQEAVLLDNRGFTFAPGRGLSSFEPITQGDTLGYRGTAPVIASHTGVILFPKLPEHQSLGKPVCYIATQ